MSTDPRPLAEFFDLLPIAPGFTWGQLRNDELAGLGSADVLAFELADPLWGGSVVLDWSEWPEARRLAAMVRSLSGPMQSFLMTNPIAEYPAADPDGSILGSSEVSILAIGEDNRSLSLAGLPEGYVIGWGDFAEVTFSTDPVRRFVFEFHGDGVADSSGETEVLPIGPAIWPGVLEDAVVNLKRPAAKFFIVPGTLREGSVRSAIVDGMSFTVQQRR